MITLRPAAERFHTRAGWLDSHHTFSFADHYDPDFLGFRSLRVINDDTVAAGQGFGTHPHRDMEIISYVLDGALAHKDSLGTGSVIRPGDVQRMSAGTGVQHSEFNASKTEPVHFLQIWIVPRQRGIPAGYEQKSFGPEDVRGKLRLLAAPDGRDGAVALHADAALYAAVLDEGERASLELGPGRYAWVHVARGSIDLGGKTLVAGDGAALSDEPRVALAGRKGGGEVLVFDLA